MVGNIYKKDLQRVVITKQLSSEYVTCKIWGAKIKKRIETLHIKELNNLKQIV